MRTPAFIQDRIHYMLINHSGLSIDESATTQGDVLTLRMRNGQVFIISIQEIPGTNNE
jgi:hypothetical protein